MKPVLFLTIAIIAFSTTGKAQVGVGTTTPNSTLDVRGSFSTSFRQFNAAITLNDTDHTVMYAGSTNTTVTLPSAATCTGRTYVIRNAASGLATPQLTIATTAAQTIDGNANWMLDEPAEVVALTSNGTGWNVCQHTVPVYKTSTSGAGWLAGGNVLQSAKAIGTQTNVDLPFMTNGTEKMRLTNSGNLGLGTTSPTHLLELISATDPLLLGGIQTGMPTDSLLTIENGIVKKIAQTAMPSAPTNIWSTLGNSGCTPESNFMGTIDNASLRMRTNNTQRMIIDSTGNVGIGVALPANRLEVNSGDAGASGLTLTQMPEGAILFTNSHGEVVQNTSVLYADAANNRLSVAAGTSPNSTLSVGGSVSLPVVSRTANYTLSASDYTVLCNSISGAFTVTLPVASTAAGRIYVVKKTSSDGNLIILHATGSDYIDGAANYYLYAPYSYITVQSDGVSTWNVIGQR